MKQEHEEVFCNSLRIASQEIQRLAETVDRKQIELLTGEILKRSQTGSILVIGAGTSGVAARKIVHGLRCQEFSAHFLAPSDALHGASGAVRKDDLVIAISNGGTSDAVNKTVDIARQRGAHVIAVTAMSDSPLAAMADDLVIVDVEQESDYAGLLATASILCVIALFDAVISVIMAERNFSTEAFGRIHPDGRVGSTLADKQKH